MNKSCERLSQSSEFADFVNLDNVKSIPNFSKIRTGNMLPLSLSLVSDSVFRQLEFSSYLLRVIT